MTDTIRKLINRVLDYVERTPGESIHWRDEKGEKMAEYIDREKMYLDFKECNENNPKWTPQRVATLIYRQNAADVEHIIRCKDCKYSRELNHEDPKERQFIEGCVWCTNWEYGVFPDDYCSNAKRRK